MIIANIFTCLFLTCLYNVYFAALYLILSSLLIFIEKILAWYGEMVCVLLAVASVVAYLHGLSLSNISDVLFQL
jgi:hypothetical protein